MKTYRSKEDKQPEKEGPPWKTVLNTSTYEAADARRQKFLQEWSTHSVEGMQVKVKRMLSTETYTVRTRLDPEFSPKKAKPEKKIKPKRKSRDEGRDKKRARKGSRK